MLFLSAFPILEYLIYVQTLYSSLSMLNYLDEWTLNSITSIYNLAAAAVLYSAITLLLFIRDHEPDGKWLLITSSLAPVIYLASNITVYYIDFNHIDLGLVSWGLPYLNGYLVTEVLKTLGFKTFISTYPYGTLIKILIDGSVKSIFIGWPCTGVTGFFLYTSFIMLEYLYLARSGYKILVISSIEFW